MIYLKCGDKMKKIYVSLLLLIALFAFIFFVVDINFSGNVNNNTEVKKDINYIYP